MSCRHASSRWEHFDPSVEGGPTLPQGGYLRCVHCGEVLPHGVASTGNAVGVEVFAADVARYAEDGVRMSEIGSVFSGLEGFSHAHTFTYMLRAGWFGLGESSGALWDVGWLARQIYEHDTHLDEVEVAADMLCCVDDGV